MTRRDFVLRLIEQAIRFLHELIGLVEVRRFPEALTLVNEGYRQFFGMDSDTLIRLPVSYLREQIGDDAEGTVLMASLLEAEGDVLVLMENETAAYPRWVLALTLLLEGYAAGMTLTHPNLPATVESLSQRLKPYTLAAPLNGTLFGYYTTTGNYALAENYLWEWSAAATEQTVSAAGQAFYEGLLALDNATLERGGLTRGEVEEGLWGWREKTIL